MGWVAGCCLSFLFLFIGYSTLLHFFVEEKRRLFVFDVFFPRPRRGRVISCFCFFISFSLLVLLIFSPLDEGGFAKSAIVMVLIFVFYPVVFLAAYLLAGFRRESNRYVFSLPLQWDFNCWKVPIICSSVITLVLWFAW